MRSQLTAMFLVFSLSANAQTLSGAIDMHAHADPDGVPRKIDAVDLARLAKEHGMRAIVLKDHYEPTASLAYIVRKDVPGIEVFVSEVAKVIAIAARNNLVLETGHSSGSEDLVITRGG
jgi:Family of unknown function (DUF6282)